MELHFDKLNIVIPDWLLLLLAILLLVQTVLSLISSYYSYKLARLKAEEVKHD